MTEMMELTSSVGCGFQTNQWEAFDERGSGRNTLVDVQAESVDERSELVAID
jgi:hypothetical protein